MLAGSLPETPLENPDAAPGARRRALQRVLAATVLTRLVVAASVWVGAGQTRRVRHLAPDGHPYYHDPWRLLDGLARWDTDYYLRVAEEGYRASGGPPYEAAFFPLYPALMRLVSAATGLSLVTAGVVLSQACFLLAVWVLFRLLEEVAGPDRAAGATVALLAFPGSLFLSAAYTESLFLLLSAAAVLAARRRAFLVASALVALAALTRPNGVLVAVPVALEAAVARRRGERVFPGALALALPVLALGLHAAYLGKAYGDPLAFAHVQAEWGRGLAPPWKALLTFQFDPEYYVVALGWIAAVIWAAGRQPISFQAYALLSLALPLCSGTLKSFPRFAAVCFPVFLSVDDWTRRRGWRLAYLLVTLSLLAWYGYRFARFDAVN